MDTAARWAAPESPILLLDSERRSIARFNRRPWDTKEDGENTLAVMKVTYRRLTQHSRRGFTCAIYAAPASPIQLNARLSKQRFLLADLVVERADPIRRAPSSPIRLFRRDKWVRLDQKKHPKWIWHICASVCMNRCVRVLGFMWDVWLLSDSHAFFRQEKVVALLGKRVAL